MKDPVLGIDIGGTWIKSSPVDVSKGRLIGRPFKIRTPEPSTIDNLLLSFEKIIKNFSWDGPVGCGFPGVIKNGTIYTAANMSKKLLNINLAEKINDLCKYKSTVINDADAAAIAEMLHGSGKAHCGYGGGVVLVITLGTGIGSSIFVEGHLVPNTEFGHIEYRGMDIEKWTAGVIKAKENLSWEEWGRRLNTYLQIMEKLSNPDLFIIGGGIAESFDKFRHYIDLRAKITCAKMGNNAGIIGAAIWAGKE